MSEFSFASYLIETLLITTDLKSVGTESTKFISRTQRKHKRLVCNKTKRRKADAKINYNKTSTKTATHRPE
ncbi:hypothetical protein CSQ88_14255 [Iodobacter sp. BJB302]|nr:hypothetical protein CSQ88_14255 [Iodobacter sp. BJB302]